MSVTEVLFYVRYQHMKGYNLILLKEYLSLSFHLKKMDGL